MALAAAEMMLLTFPGERVGQGTVDAIRGAVDAGLRVIDLFFVSRGWDRQVRVVELAGDGWDGLRVKGVGRVGQDDAGLLAAAVRPGTSAAVIVFQRPRDRPLPAALTAVGEVALHATVSPEPFASGQHGVRDPGTGADEGTGPDREAAPGAQPPAVSGTRFTGTRFTGTR